ncbi:MAG TPA: hypothetical protein VN943_06810 [Candidatus Acidoferrum sp.]|nr:hypothetical protein [Candidatus Acidoferrum sp.]
MRVARRIISTVVSAVLSAPLLAQQSAPVAVSIQATVTRDPKALTLLNQSLSVMGAIASPTRMTFAQGTMTYPDGSQKSVTMTTLGADHVRNDLGSGEFTFVSAGGDGFIGMNGKRHKLQPWATQFKRPDHLPALTLMSELQQPNLQAKYLGLEDVNGGPSHHKYRNGQHYEETKPHNPWDN